MIPKGKGDPLQSLSEELQWFSLRNARTHSWVSRGSKGYGTSAWSPRTRTAVVEHMGYEGAAHQREAGMLS